MGTEMKQFIDLHLHSNCSDGVFSPAELVEMAHRVGLVAIAIADHDSVAGVTEAIITGITAGIEVIPAIELSVQFASWNDVHLLGYGIDHTDCNFLERLGAFRERREKRNVEILDLVNKRLNAEKKEAIQLKDVLASARDSIGRPHIARVLQAKGYVNSTEEAFRRYLSPCNIPKFYWPIDSAINEIRQLGGVAILAHPVTITDDRRELHVVIAQMQNMGLDGIEVFNNISQPDEMEYLRRFAEERNLLITGGSDFHCSEDSLEMGKGRGGVRFENNLLPPLKKLITERQENARVALL